MPTAHTGYITTAEYAIFKPMALSHFVEVDFTYYPLRLSTEGQVVQNEKWDWATLLLGVLLSADMS